MYTALPPLFGPSVRTLDDGDELDTRSRELLVERVETVDVEAEVSRPRVRRCGIDRLFLNIAVLKDFEESVREWQPEHRDVEFDTWIPDELLDVGLVTNPASHELEPGK